MARTAASGYIDGGKLLRLHDSLAAMVDESTRAELDAAVTGDLRAVTGRFLVEIGSALPDDLLDELRLLVGATDDELRLLRRQLLGWVEGVLSALVVATIPDDGELSQGEGGEGPSPLPSLAPERRSST
jgi:hypothetical protein